MTGTNLYGDALASEKVAEENQICRGMVKQITDYGVNQRQVLMLIYLLGLELEAVEQMRAITATVKSLQSGVLLVKDEVEDGTQC
jgi:hypothetical protein